VIEDVIQFFGYVTPQLATFGRYRRVRSRDPLLLEGTVGFLPIAITMYVAYRWSRERQSFDSNI
jgi:hypothetical protein